MLTSTIYLWDKMVREKLVNRLTIDFSEYPIKKAIDSLFILVGISILYSILFLFTMTTGNQIMGAFVLLSVITYEFLSLSALDRIMQIRFKKNRNFILLKNSVIAISLAVLFYVFFSLTDVILDTPIIDKFSALFIASALLITPIFFWKEILANYKKIIKVSIILLLAPNPIMAQDFVAVELNDTINATTDSVQSTVSVLQAVTGFLEAFQGAIGSVGNLKETIIEWGFTDTQTTAVFLLIAVVIFYFLFKMLKWFTKWVVMAVFVWLVLQILGIL